MIFIRFFELLYSITSLLIFNSRYRLQNFVRTTYKTFVRILRFYCKYIFVNLLNICNPIPVRLSNKNHNHKRRRACGLNDKMYVGNTKCFSNNKTCTQEHCKFNDFNEQHKIHEFLLNRIYEMRVRGNAF